MPARTSTLSPEAIRQRRCRRRQREELSFAYSEVPWRVIELLINHGRITENEAANANRRGEAILKAAEEFLDGCHGVTLETRVRVVDSTVQQERGRRTMANETLLEQFESALCA